MADLSEVWTAVLNVLAGDSTLTDKLGDSNQIHYGIDIRAQTSPPLLRCFIIDDGQDTQLSALGKFRTRLQIDVFGYNPVTNEQIVSRMDELLDIPKSRTTVISSANFEVREMHRVTAQRVGLVDIRSSAQRLEHVVTEWIAKVVSTA